MKKLVLALIFCFITSTAFGSIITYDSSVTGSSASLDWLKGALNTVYNNVNGSIDSTNIAAGGVNSTDIATAANPLTRENELIGEIVYSGLTIATSATLTSTITAGVAYIENDGDGTLHRVVTDATQKTFTASKDTWVYLNYVGAFYYNEQTTGASQPTTQDNYILIAKVVTNGTAITSVTDYRQTTPTNLRIYNNYKSGCVISRDVSTATTLYVKPGEIEFGTTGKVRRNTSNTTINLATTGRNALDTGTLAAGTFYYIFAVPDDDTTTNFDVIASISSTDATGVTDERLIGWCYANSASSISPDSLGAYKGLGGDAPNYGALEQADGPLTIAIGAEMPTTRLRFYSSGRPVAVDFSCTAFIDATAQTQMVDLYLDDVSIGRGVWGTITDPPHEHQVCINRVVIPSAGTHTIYAKNATLDNMIVSNDVISFVEL